VINRFSFLHILIWKWSHSPNVQRHFFLSSWLSVIASLHGSPLFKNVLVDYRHIKFREFFLRWRAPHAFAMLSTWSIILSRSLWFPRRRGRQGNDSKNLCKSCSRKTLLVSMVGSAVFNPNCYVRCVNRPCVVGIFHSNGQPNF